MGECRLEDLMISFERKSIKSVVVYVEACESFKLSHGRSTI